MPALPWVAREPIEPGRTYTVMFSKLPLRRASSIPGFLRDTLAIRQQLGATSGLIGYSLDAELARRTFWTFSVWADQASLDAFAATDPHARIIRRLRPLMAPTRFSTTRLTGANIPTTWVERKAPVR
jgi:quinol monooxygenase YgiN